MAAISYARMKIAQMTAAFGNKGRRFLFAGFGVDISN
jgi:hypothetical protein